MEKESFKDNSKGKDRAEKILKRLETEFEISAHGEGSAFLTLVRTILSQNTNRRNTEKAFENLTARFEAADEIAKAEREEIIELIKPAGLYKNKSKSIHKIAKELAGKSDLDLDKTLRKEPEDAREELLGLPGVGPKTADCVLLFAGNRDVLPVDTHVARISKRLGFAGQKAGPEEVKESLEPLLPEGERGKAHLLLIKHGREYCNARNPDCENCPIETFCPKIGLGEA